MVNYQQMDLVRAKTLYHLLDLVVFAEGDKKDEPL